MEFKITDYQMDEFSTMYKVEYNGQTYVCNYNGGLPRLQQCKLTESQRSDLKDLLEEFFHFQMCEKLTPKQIKESNSYQHLMEEYEGYFFGEDTDDSSLKQILIFDEVLHIEEYKSGHYSLVLGNQDWYEPNLNPLVCRLFTYSKLYI
tara:strand:+ start:1068 stop:1511 length:444 start_codon:yes stop_codon:yes gene_type:complete